MPRIMIFARVLFYETTHGCQTAFTRVSALAKGFQAPLGFGKDPGQLGALAPQSENEILVADAP
jgi:hypothetical protein